MKPIPTIVQLQETISNDIKGRLNLTGTLKRVLNAFTIVLSGQLKLNYNFLGDIQDNVFPDKADLEVDGGTLERQGRMWIGRNPFPESPGSFNLSMTGISGTVLRAGLTFKSNEDSLNPGQLYVLDSEYILNNSSNIIEVRSLGGGASYNLNVGDNVTITEPVIGINQTLTVSSVVTEPKNAEDIDVYRQIIIDSRQLEPQGGSKTDYRLWASDAQGVRKVYPYVRNGSAGIVDVYVEATTDDSTDGNGTPSGALLTEVADVIEFDPDETRPTNERGRRPIQAIVETKPIVIIPVDVFIAGLSQDTTAIRNSISRSAETYLYDVRPYIAGADLPRSKNDILYEARIQSAITDVLDNANFFTAFDMQVNGGSVSSYQFDLGNIPYLRNVTYN